WPAPRIRMFMASSHQLEVRVRDHEPLRAALLEVHLHAGVGTAALGVQHDALAELAVADALSEPDSPRRVLTGVRACAALEDGARDDHRRPDLFDQLRGDLAQEPGRRGVTLLAVQAALLRVGQEQPALRAGDADVAEPPLLLEALRIVQGGLV